MTSQTKNVIILPPPAGEAALKIRLPVPQPATFPRGGALRGNSWQTPRLLDLESLIADGKERVQEDEGFSYPRTGTYSVAKS